jgi:hypothetical protein
VCKYYQLRCRLDGMDLYLIWSSNDDSDGVIVEGDGSVAAFGSRADLRAYAERLGLALEPDESGEFDFDSVESWLGNPVRGAIDCELFLNAWNLIDDVASSTGHLDFGWFSRGAGEVYDMLFWGNNLPVVTPPGEQFVPAWSQGQVAELERILSDGMRLFRDAVRVKA